MGGLFALCPTLTVRRILAAVVDALIGINRLFKLSFAVWEEIFPLPQFASPDSAKEPFAPNPKIALLMKSQRDAEVGGEVLFRRIWEGELRMGEDLRLQARRKDVWARETTTKQAAGYSPVPVDLEGIDAMRGGEEFFIPPPSSGGPASNSPSSAPLIAGLDLHKTISQFDLCRPPTRRSGLAFSTGFRRSRFHSAPIRFKRRPQTYPTLDWYIHQFEIPGQQGDPEPPAVAAVVTSNIPLHDDRRTEMSVALQLQVT
ncbi:hypothetical protein C8R46DRAFT_1206469 [Mycena filopes]|nr:hypothetical protein C8R46DRAFT_1206469 [Mycena filopes]